MTAHRPGPASSARRGRCCATRARPRPRRRKPSSRYPCIFSMGSHQGNIQGQGANHPYGFRPRVQSPQRNTRRQTFSKVVGSLFQTRMIGMTSPPTARLAAGCCGPEALTPEVTMARVCGTLCDTLCGTDGAGVWGTGGHTRSLWHRRCGCVGHCVCGRACEREPCRVHRTVRRVEHNGFGPNLGLVCHHLSKLSFAEFRDERLT
jgi:hypothetical protein